MPAVAVIRRFQALLGFTGRKESVGGFLSPILKPPAYPGTGVGYWKARVVSGLLEFAM